MSSKQPEIYYHLGLAKTASTFLQNRFFPKLEGTKYIKTKRFVKLTKFTEASYLVSGEVDRNFYEAITFFAEKYPNAKPIVFLRRHDSWLASQYRRYVKNGGNFTFAEFVGVPNDTGFWKHHEARFAPMLEHLVKSFEQKPFILFFDDFKKDPKAIMRKLAKYTNTSFDIDKIDTSPVHKAFSDKQLYYITKYNKLHPGPKNGFKNWWHYRSRWLWQHILLYISVLYPNSENAVIVTKEQLHEVEAFFRTDWQACKKFAAEHSYK